MGLLSVISKFFKPKEKRDLQRELEKQRSLEEYRNIIENFYPKKILSRKSADTLEQIQKQWDEGVPESKQIKERYVSYISPGRDRPQGHYKKGAYPTLEKEGILLIRWRKAASEFATSAGLEKIDRKTLLQVSNEKLMGNPEALKKFLEETKNIRSMDYEKELAKYRTGACLARLMARAGELPDKTILEELERIKNTLDGPVGFMDASCARIYAGEYAIIDKESNNIFPSEKGLYVLYAYGELKKLAEKAGMKSADRAGLRGLWSNKEGDTDNILKADSEIEELRKKSRDRHEKAMEEWRNKPGLQSLYGRPGGGGLDKLFEKQ